MPAYIDLAAALIKRLEGCKLVGYPDSKSVPTDGYGNTHGAKIGVSISQETADRDLVTNLETADHLLLEVAPKVVALPDHKRAALVSFVFNLGAKANWTIWKDIAAGKLDDVPPQMRRFDKVEENGKLVEVQGLDKRRAAEIAFWNTADVVAAVAAASVPTSRTDATPVVAATPPSSATRAASTPPTPLPAPPGAPISLAAKATTAIAGAAALAGQYGSQIHSIVAPHADESHIFATLATAASGVVVAAAIVGLLLHAEQAHLRTV